MQVCRRTQFFLLLFIIIFFFGKWGKYTWCDDPLNATVYYSLRVADFAQQQEAHQ